jgi:hypothetical protein
MKASQLLDERDRELHVTLTHRALGERVDVLLGQLQPARLWR